MTTPELNHTVGLEEIRAPWIVRRHAGRRARAIWRNAARGVTFVGRDRVVKWHPDQAGHIDLFREWIALRWLRDLGHPVPRTVTARTIGQQILVTRRLDAESAVSERWLAEPEIAVRAIADGLRALHSIPVDRAAMTEAFESLDDEVDSWFDRHHDEAGVRPEIAHPVLVHGDACAPNTLLDADGAFAAHVDVGALGIGDRWADLAIASMSLDWNYGEGWQEVFFDAYGVARDEERIAYYRAMWDLEP